MNKKEISLKYDTNFSDIKYFCIAFLFSFLSQFDLFKTFIWAHIQTLLILFFWIVVTFFPMMIIFGFPKSSTD